MGLVGMPIHEDHREAFSNLGLMQQVVSSSDPQWSSQSDHTPRKRNLRNMNSTLSTDGLSDIALSDSPMAGAHANGHVSPAGLPLAGTPHFHTSGYKHHQVLFSFTLAVLQASLVAP